MVGFQEAGNKIIEVQDKMNGVGVETPRFP